MATQTQIMSSVTSDSTLYAPLRNNKNDLTDLDNPRIAPPKDDKNLVYISFLSCGIGFILPYSSFIVAADYWQDRFKGKSVAIDMSLTYILTACCTAFANNLVISLIPFRWRILLGYTISFFMLLFITVCEVAFHVFSKTTAYSVCLFAILVVSFGCTIQQSSIYGFSSTFPNKYTQAVMAGESVAGFLVSSNRVLTKLWITDERLSTIIFFTTSITYVAISYILHNLSMKTTFVKHYTNQCFEANKRRANEIKMGVYNSNEKHLKLPMSFSNPLYNPAQLEISSDATQSVEKSTIVFKDDHTVLSAENGIQSRWDVVKTIFPYMTSIAISYFVTLSLYPGIESEIISCSLHSWMPVLMMFTFNAADLTGKVLAALPYSWTARQLILFATLRIIIVPLLLLCCAPRKQPIINGEIPPFVFTAAFGLTNGLAGSLPMILASNKVPVAFKEIAGNIMTLSYNIGMVIGSVIGYIFDNIIGDKIEDLTTVCPIYPYGPYLSHMQTSTEKSRVTFTTTLYSVLNSTQQNFDSETTTPFILSENGSTVD